MNVLYFKGLKFLCFSFKQLKTILSFIWTWLYKGFEMLEAVVHRCSIKKGVLQNFTKFTGKHLCLRPATSLKKRLWHRWFCVNFKNTFFLQNSSGGCFWSVTVVASKISCTIFYTQLHMYWKVLVASPFWALASLAIEDYILSLMESHFTWKSSLILAYWFDMKLAASFFLKFCSIIEHYSTRILRFFFFFSSGFLKLECHLIEKLVLFALIKPFKNDESAFYFILKKKRLDKKTKVNFKIYDVINWEINNYNTHIA